jgi:hypothetical protein
LTAEKVGRATLVCRRHGVMLVRDTPVAIDLRSPIVSLNKNPPSSGGPSNAPEPHRTMATVKATRSPAVIASCSMSNATNKILCYNGYVLLASPPTMLGPPVCAFGCPHGRAF